MINIKSKRASRKTVAKTKYNPFLISSRVGLSLFILSIRLLKPRILTEIINIHIIESVTFTYPPYNNRKHFILTKKLRLSSPILNGNSNNN